MKVGDKIRILKPHYIGLYRQVEKNGIVEINGVDSYGNGEFLIDGDLKVIPKSMPSAWEIVEESDFRILGGASTNLAFDDRVIQVSHKEQYEMTTEEYFEFIEELHKSMVSLVRKKNADYTGGVSPFANFKASEAFGVDPIVGLSVRMGDKMQRLQSYCKNGKLEVDGEGVEDVFRDFIGYAWLGLGMLKERKLNE